MSQHILFSVNHYPPHVGGLENFVGNLAEALVTHGHRCTVFTVDREEGEEIRNGVRVIRIKGSLNIGEVFSFPRRNTLQRMKRMIATEDVTAVSLHTRFFPMTWLGLKAARAENVPSILTELGSDFVRGVNPIVWFSSRLIDLTLGRWAMKSANVLLAISDSSAKFVRRLSGRIATVFHNAIDIDFWSAPTSLQPNNVVFVGRIVPGKGWREAVDVFNQLAPDNPNIALHLFGSGPAEPELDRQIKESKAAVRIHFHGPQPRDVIRAQLAGAVFVNATTLAEGFQTTLLEALASNARIVSYPTPGLNDLEATGAQIWRANSIDSLASEVSAAFATAPTHLSKEQLASWGWPDRAATYASIVSSAIRRANSA